MGCFNRVMELQIIYKIEIVAANSCEHKILILQDTLGGRQREACY